MAKIWNTLLTLAVAAKDYIVGIRNRLRPLKPKEHAMVAIGTLGIVVAIIGMYANSTVVLAFGAFIVAADFVVTAYYLLHRHDGDAEDVG